MASSSSASAGVSGNGEEVDSQLYVGLRDIFDPGSWTEGALCRQTDPEIFFPEKGEKNTVAREICSRCEVREECLEYVDRVEADMPVYDFHGIFAGMSRAERLSRREEISLKDQL